MDPQPSAAYPDGAVAFLRGALSDTNMLAVLPDEMPESAMGHLLHCVDVPTARHLVLKTTRYHPYDSRSTSSSSRPFVSWWDPTLIQEAYILARLRRTLLKVAQAKHKQSNGLPQETNGLLTKTLSSSSVTVACLRTVVATRPILPLLRAASAECPVLHVAPNGLLANYWPAGPSKQNHGLLSPTSWSLASYSEQHDDHPECLYLALDRADGGDLYSWIEKHQTRPTSVGGRQIAKMLNDVADSLHALHSGGWCHRDLKPENVLIDRFGTAQLCDFGFSRPSATSEEILGTVEYHSPELWYSGYGGPPADMWAFGMVLHRILRRSDPDYFNDMVTFYELRQRRNRFAGQRVRAAKLASDLACALSCQRSWKMDAAKFKEQCATLCVPIGTVRTLWHIYIGCLQTDPARRWTAEEVLAALATAAEPATSLVATSATAAAQNAALLSIQARPGFQFQSSANSSPFRFRVPVPIARGSRTPPPLLPAQESTLLSSAHQEEPPLSGVSLAHTRQFAHSLASCWCWDQPNAVLVFQTAVDIYACLHHHIVMPAVSSSADGNNMEEVRFINIMVRLELATLNLTACILLDNSTSAGKRLGLTTRVHQLLDVLCQPPHDQPIHQIRNSVAHLERLWLNHLLVAA